MAHDSSNKQCRLFYVLHFVLVECSWPPEPRRLFYHLLSLFGEFVFMVQERWLCRQQALGLSPWEEAALHFWGVFSPGIDLLGHWQPFPCPQTTGPLSTLWHSFSWKFTFPGITIFPYITCHTSVAIVRVCYLFIDFQSLVIMLLSTGILNFLWFLPSDKFRAFCPLRVLIFFCFFSF